MSGKAVGSRAAVSFLVKVVWRAIALTGFLAFTALSYAHEPPSGLLVHLPFDGDAADVGPHGLPVDWIGENGELAGQGPEFREGRFGQAVYFNGSGAARIALDLHPDFYPQVTIAAWVRRERNASGYIVSNTNRNGHVLQASGNPYIRFQNTNKGSSAPMHPDRWTFIAGLWDYRDGTAQLYVGRRSDAWTFELNPDLSPRSNLWIGAWDDLGAYFACGLLVDDVRVYDRLLTAEELARLQTGRSMAS